MCYCLDNIQHVCALYVMQCLWNLFFLVCEQIYTKVGKKPLQKVQYLHWSRSTLKSVCYYGAIDQPHYCDKSFLTNVIHVLQIWVFLVKKCATGYCLGQTCVIPSTKIQPAEAILSVKIYRDFQFSKNN